MCMETFEKYTCCFFGNRTIDVTEELTTNLNKTIRKLIVEKEVDTFLFGSKSQFNDLCYEQVTRLKEEHPHIKRIYVRAEFPHIPEGYEVYLRERYEDSYYPDAVKGAGKAVYLQRNRTMIDNSRFCVVYCRENYAPPNRKSGTVQSLDYATKKNKEIIRL